MDIKKIKLSELLPDDQNANKGTDRGREALEASLRKYGFGRSILLDKQGRIIAGNKTHEIASEIGLEDVLIVQVDGRQVVAVQRTDLDLDDPMARELAIADNRVGELDLSWDADVLQRLSELDGVDITAFWDDKELTTLLAESDQDIPDSSEWGEALGNLPSGDRRPFQEMSFIFHDEQLEIVKQAIRVASSLGEFDSPNESKKGNAIARICEIFLSHHDS